MTRLSVQQLATAGFLVAVAAILALAGIGWNFARQTLEASSFVSHTHQVISVTSDIQSDIYRSEAAQRAFIASRNPVYLDERDATLAVIDTGLRQFSWLTADNPQQQARVAELRGEIAARVQVFHENETLQPNETPQALDERLSRGVRRLERVRALLDQINTEERRLLAEREAVEDQRSQSTVTTFIVFLVALVLLLGAIAWRLRLDWAARQRAEQAVGEERRYDALHARALTLYNAQATREVVLAETLALIGENPLFPVAVFYEHEEWGGVLRTVARHNAPADLKSVLRIDDGVVGAVARSGKPAYLEHFDAASGLRIETGLASLHPAALLVCPVSYQGRLIGVLALAAAAPLSARDRGFVERLCAQFAVALHNLGQLQELNLLAEQLRVRGEDIQVKNAELEKADRMKSEFLANMSHELRTPLNAVIGFSGLMKDGLAGDLNAEQREYANDIHVSGKHLLSLINDILDLSKVESGHMPLELGAAEPSHIMTSAVSLMREKAATRRLRLNAVCAPDLGSLQLDLRKSKQIVFNLLSNAIKFTPEGGVVTLAMKRVARAEVDGVLEAQDTRVFRPAERTLASFLEIRVEDSGIGIAPGGIGRLFQPFVQIDSSLSREYEGTGLGLTMVKRLVELHGGGLMLRSTPNVGTTFVVWLPWRPAADETQREPPLPEPVALPASHGGSREAAPDAPLILIVEDDPRTATLMRAQLESDGYRVEVARSAEDGLTRAAALMPAALVLDIILPGRDGWDLLSQLKEQPQTGHIPVVIVSITAEARRGFALGASQVLTKPVSKDDLLAALAAVGLDGQLPAARVLVVDDDPKAVTLVGKHLKSAGLVPMLAYSGREALEVVRQQRPALIVLDLMMPQLSGFDVIEALRGRSDTADIPIIVLTAKLLTVQDRALLSGRVQQVMEKSDFQPASLLAEVRRALAKGRPRQARTA
ncbi:response regulator [Rhizobacter sp. SG703]|uniref:response regulator n=1 Tax=Rhizobacter sp. SG703 TaxID=2587140 RepID=UPI001447D40D|nr:response regulator [Rhizobacter sp. SG703]NKI97085.1 signal transduction histidine kinase/CheY-like chemotaxis protein/CHASE3 domain sensor protein [Rhizobacter sp. SG703]